MIRTLPRFGRLLRPLPRHPPLHRFPSITNLTLPLPSPAQVESWPYTPSKTFSTETKKKKKKRTTGVMQPTAAGLKTTWFMNLMQQVGLLLDAASATLLLTLLPLQVSASRIFSERKKIELYPPFFMMRITVLQLKNQWRSVKIKLPLNIFSRNPGGVMFGGYQAALADPIAALACSRIFPGHSCWTRAMTVDFKLGGSTGETSKALQVGYHSLTRSLRLSSQI